MKVKFTKIRYKNFLSTGNAWTEIDLTAASTTLICGKNGAGKSTFIDATFFALFGKPFRKINKPTLINSINKKGLIVELEFEIGSKHYLVRRGMKPNVFDIEVDGTPLKQDSKSTDFQEHLESMILQTNRKALSQIVCIGTGFVPFMSLKAEDRREIIENILDINMFTRMNILAKGEMAALKESIRANEASLSNCNEKIAMQEGFVRKISADTSKQIDDKREAIKTIDDGIEKIDAQIQVVDSKLKKLLSVDEILDKIRSKRSDINTQIMRQNDEIVRLDDVIQFYYNNETCPTCNQDLDGDHCQEQKDEAVLKRAKAKTEKTTLEATLEGIETKFKMANELLDQKNKLVSQKQSLSYSRQPMVSQKQALLNEINDLQSDRSSLSEEQDKLSSLKGEKKSLEVRKVELASEKEVLDVSALLLKDDGIKTRIIKEYIPAINKYINHYLEILGFFVEFHLDENFQETIKSRFRDEFSFENFSEGEKMRINLAILFAWREIAKQKNSVNVNLLIMDEIFDGSLDGDGLEDFTKLLNTLKKDQNIFIISHKSNEIEGEFERVLRFEKRKNFSVAV